MDYFSIDDASTFLLPEYCRLPWHRRMRGFQVGSALERAGPRHTKQVPLIPVRLFLLAALIVLSSERSKMIFRVKQEVGRRNCTRFLFVIVLRLKNTLIA